MVFSSMIFLWVFLPVTLVLSRVFRGKACNLLLLAASLVFYAWGEPVYVLLMIFSILFNYVIGLLIGRAGDPSNISLKRIWLILGIVGNILLLGYYKYCDFFIGILNDTLFRNTPLELKYISLPIGISFFTFQAMSYIIDLYRGKYPAQKDLFSLALYISFFPQLIAGPIVRYEDMEAQLSKRDVNTELTIEGFRRFIYGLAKKVIISNTLAQTTAYFWNMEGEQMAPLYAWTSAIFYTLQIYYDFSGYSDMAIGLGKMFGFTIPENFNYPYMSASVSEFWRRWHMTLGAWFREYVYIPLGGSRRGKVRTCINLAIVFFLTGLWHGAAYQFVLWGIYYAFFMVIERAFLKKWLDKHRIVGHIYTLFAVVLGWVMFSTTTAQNAIYVIGKKMFLIYDAPELVPYVTYRFLSAKKVIIAVLAVVGCGPLQLAGQKLHLTEKWKGSIPELVFCGIVFAYCVITLAAGTYNPFIYFRF
ncbi:MAG: MBOAT family protein [Lachnospiraceae bacterium]|nr:MBOAT family protein [Lachnospiraceae bacterium]